MICSRLLQSGRQDIEQQLAMDGAGIAELDWGKKDRAKWLAISISGDHGSQSMLILEHDKAEQDAAAIRERIDKWQVRAATALAAGIDGGAAPPMHAIGKNDRAASTRVGAAALRQRRCVR